MPTSDNETFGEVLRRHRERRGLTQLSAAELVGVSRATFTQWEGNKHLPSLVNVQELDRALKASGVLLDALESSRSEGSRARPLSAPPGPAGPTVATVSRDARAALDGQLCFDDEGRPIGWRHNLVPSFERPSLVSTSFGLRAQALLGGPDAHTPALVDRMLAAGVAADGTITGWRASTQHAPRLEMTTAAIESLLRAGVPLKVDRVVEVVRRLLDDETARERPSILSQAVEPLLRIAADSELTGEVVTDLLDCRRDFQGVLLWPEKRLRRDQPLLEPSVAQTARAVTALRDAPFELVADAVLAAEEWLAEQADLGEDTEIIRRTLGDGTREELALHTFTPALVVQALAGARRPDVRAINRALRPVWERYVPSLHLWAWSNGDVPVWMLVDGVAALQAAADALLTGPSPV